jgi:molybdenum cofactor biosynthesis enzyme MoaA
MNFINLTKTRPIDIRFIEYMPFDGNKWSEKKLMTYHDALHHIQQYTEKPFLKLVNEMNDTAKSYRVEGYRGMLCVVVVNVLLLL